MFICISIVYSVHNIQNVLLHWRVHSSYSVYELLEKKMTYMIMSRYQTLLEVQSIQSNASSFYDIISATLVQTHTSYKFIIIL